jgi:hypothetical protein
VTAPFPSMRTWTPGELATSVLLNAQIRDPISFARQRPHHFLTNTANISHTTTGAWQAITWNTEIPDEPNGHGTANSFITCQVSGLYDIRCQVLWQANATGGRALRLINHGATSIGGVATNGTLVHVGMMSSCMTPDGAAFTLNTVESAQEVSCKRLLQAGDAVRVEAFQNSGGALNMLADYAATQIHSYFSLRWLAST